MSDENAIPKLVITGHKDGIGKSIADAFWITYRVKGYDIVDGDDIRQPEVHERFIEDCADAEIIILNAHTPDNHLILKELYETYKDQDKLCIVLGSMVTSKTFEKIKAKGWGFDRSGYYEQKAELDKMCARIANDSENYGTTIEPFRITMLRLGWVDTKLATEWKGDLLPTEAVVNTIRHILVHRYVWHIPTLELQIREHENGL